MEQVQVHIFIINYFPFPFQDNIYLERTNYLWTPIVPSYRKIASKNAIGSIKIQGEK
jgi:hypothetical protein